MIKDKLLQKFTLFTSKKVVKNVEKYTVVTALILFVLNIVFVLFETYLPIDFNFIESTNLLSTLSTPFSIILLFEIFLVICAIAVSFEDSVGLQYQTISLLVLRNIFKDISNITDLSIYSIELQTLMLDMVAALLFFVLVIRYFALRKKIKNSTKVERIDKNHIEIKKMASFFALLIFVILLLLSILSVDLNQFNFDFYYFLNIPEFLNSIFTVLILIDIGLLIISYLSHHHYEILFINGGLIVSIIITRLALTVDGYLGTLFSLGGILFGVIIYNIYYYSIKVFD